MPYNEQETRFFLIDRILWDKGYNSHQRIKMETPAPVEPSGHKGRRRKGAVRVDYLLRVQLAHMPQPLPVGVLEAKHAGEDPLKGMQPTPTPSPRPMTAPQRRSSKIFKPKAIPWQAP